MQKLKPYLISISLTLAIGALSALFTMNNMDIYQNITKPPIAPPSIVFPIVWTILYILMGISSARIYNKGGSLTVYFLQLFLNFCWSIIFFNYQAYLFAFLWLILLWISILYMILDFYKTDKLATYLQIPYLLWVTFAGILNLMIYLLN
ncbi:MAG: tryptophan-rich sensory protein [Erysipelotrichaceae bacterium]|nr:tryptophan-rich sensory protein [Erysipelotrichaceae bacterium]